MKATLTFDLDDPNDREVYRRHNKADDMASVLWDLCHNKSLGLCDDCKQKIWDIKAEYNINLEELWT